MFHPGSFDFNVGFCLNFNLGDFLDGEIELEAGVCVHKSNEAVQPTHRS